MTLTLARPVTAPPAAPYSSLIRKAAGVCLILAKLQVRDRREAMLKLHRG